MSDDAGLKYSEELLRALVSTLSDTAFVIDEHGRYVEILAQPRKDSLLAADTVTLKGKLLHDVVPMENADLVLSVVQKTIELQENQHVEYLLPVQAGERWFEGRTAPLRIPGQDKTVIWVSRDITDRKQAETALRTNARLLSESQRLGHVGSVLFDKQGGLSWSDEMYNVYGVSPDMFKPSLESFMGLIHPDDRAAMQAWNASCAAGEIHGSLDFRINRPDGTVRFIRGNGDVVYDDQGALAFLAGMAQDVTGSPRS